MTVLLSVLVQARVAKPSVLRPERLPPTPGSQQQHLLVPSTPRVHALSVPRTAKPLHLAVQVLVLARQLLVRAHPVATRVAVAVSTLTADAANRFSIKKMAGADHITVSPEALATSQRLHLEISTAITEAGGWMPFSRFMQMALYTPGLGYYAAGSAKLADARLNVEDVQPSGNDNAAPAPKHPLSTSQPSSSSSPTSTSHASTVGLQGDFVTAPQLTPLFGRTLARQIAEVLQATGTKDILEFGAGTGALASDILQAMHDMGIAVRYQILEVSADLAMRQQARLASWGASVQWINRLPDQFEGCIIGNEVLDAMPVEVFAWTPSGDLVERGVTMADNQFTWSDRPASAELTEAISSRCPAFPGYQSEINLQAEAWMRSLASCLTKGAAILIDYGFPRHEYYHPQRHRGTLMCHIQHRAHDDPFFAPGLQDITAHVDFTAMAKAACEAGLELLGYTSQARFLMNAGIADELQGAARKLSAASLAQTNQAIQKLLSEAEMGELFKVLVVGRGMDHPLSGFNRGDRSHQLISESA